MLPTVADVLATPELVAGEPVVHAGADRLHSAVRWVHAVELADIGHLLRGGELVLTTGIALPGTAEGLRRYVDELVEAGVAGLVVELGRRWQDLPAELVAAARSSALPLVALRREVRFAAVAQTVGERIVESQLVELRTSARIHEAFTELSVSGADNARILSEVVRMSAAPVVLESVGSRVLAYDAAGQESLALLEHWQPRSRRVRSTRRTSYIDDEGWLVTRVGAQGEDWGRLVLILRRAPSSREVVLVERAAVALALRWLVTREREILERQTQGAVLGSILAAGGEADADGGELARSCTAAGVPVVGRALVGMAVTPIDLPGREASQVRRAQMARDLAEAVAAAARDTEVPALVGGGHEASVTALLSLRTGGAVEDTVDRVARRVHESADDCGVGVIVVGAGSSVTGLGGAARTLTEARQVANAARHRRDGPLCVRLSDLHVRGLVRMLAGDERLAAFAERHVAPLRQHDEARGTRLLDTLRFLVEHGGNKAAAASAAHLSRAAYYARLAQAEKVLGVDLSDPEVLTSLHVALLASPAER